jgi:hypothetical protein
MGQGLEREERATAIKRREIRGRSICLCCLLLCSHADAAEADGLSSLNPHSLSPVFSSPRSLQQSTWARFAECSAGTGRDSRTEAGNRKAPAPIMLEQSNLPKCTSTLPFCTYNQSIAVSSVQSYNNPFTIIKKIFLLILSVLIFSTLNAMPSITS